MIILPRSGMTYAEWGWNSMRERPFYLVIEITGMQEEVCSEKNINLIMNCACRASSLRKHKDTLCTLHKLGLHLNYAVEIINLFA